MLTNQPKVSIITPSYNQGEFIERTILSVKNQDYPNIEHVVIDGGSTDNTLEILKKYEDQIVWKSEPDKGQSDAINKGLRMATGKIIGWLNSDDTYLLYAVTTVVREFLQHPEYGMVYGKCNCINENDRIVREYPVVPFSYKILLRHRSGIIPQPASFIKKNVLQEVGGLDVSLHCVMDYDLWLRIGKKYKIQYIPIVLANFRHHPQSKTSMREWERWHETLRVIKRHGGSRFSYIYLSYQWKRFRRFLRPIKQILRD